MMGYDGLTQFALFCLAKEPPYINIRKACDFSCGSAGVWLKSRGGIRRVGQNWFKQAVLVLFKGILKERWFKQFNRCAF